jgi:cytochrome c oxidase cbb3-type subunit 3
MKPIHEYDGIGELDNALPNWWLFTLYATVIFALGYWFHYHVFGNGLLPRAAYEQEMQSEYAARAARIRSMGTVTPAAIEALARDNNTVRQGHAIFTSTCAPCHGPTGGGIVGPNLTDEYWLHGGRADQIYHTISEGVPARGMMAWGPQLGNDRVLSVAAYVVTLRNTHVAGGKAPQGEREP